LYTGVEPDHSLRKRFVQNGEVSNRFIETKTRFYMQYPHSKNEFHGYILPSSLQLSYATLWAGVCASEASHFTRGRRKNGKTRNYRYA